MTDQKVIDLTEVNTFESRVVAQERLDRIKSGYADTPRLLKEFVRDESWRALDYQSMKECYEKSGLKEAVAEGEIQRKLLVKQLKDSGYTVRATAELLEISAATVSRDLSGKTGHEARDEALKDGSREVPVTPGATPDPVTPPLVEQVFGDLKPVPDDALGRPVPLEPVEDKPTPPKPAPMVPDVRVTPSSSVEADAVKFIEGLAPNRRGDFFRRFELPKRWHSSHVKVKDLEVENRRLTEANEYLKERNAALSDALGQEPDEVLPGSGY